LSVPHVHPLLSLQHGPISVGHRRSKAGEIARLTRCWVVESKARRLGPYGRAKDPLNEKQAKIDPRQESARRDDVAMIDDAPICIDDDFRKALRERRCANRRRGDR
jgi:hypothetical protein